MVALRGRNICKDVIYFLASETRDRVILNNVTYYLFLASETRGRITLKSYYTQESMVCINLIIFLKNPKKSVSVNIKFNLC